MLRRTLAAFKTSKVAITSPKSLGYTHNYRREIDYNLSKQFAAVTEQNRYESLKIIFGDKLNGYVGRRQYKLQCAGTLEEKIVEPLSQQGIDWHDLKGLGRNELLDVCDLLKLDMNTRTLFLTAVESKMCGVLTRSGKDRNPRTCCTRPGRLQHGWRCGVNGHTHDVFFENKPLASGAQLASVRMQGFLGLSSEQRQLLLDTAARGNGAQLRLPRGASSLNGPNLGGRNLLGNGSSTRGTSTSNEHEGASDTARQRVKGSTIDGANPAGTTLFGQPLDEDGHISVRMENGLQVEHRKAPDFNIVGRLQERQILNPRVWTSPNNPTFNVSVMGFELRVHPDDPRAVPQVERAHKQWEMHGEVVKHVLWEMLELYGVERPPQALDMEAGELGEPDSVFAFSSAFWGKANNTAGDAGVSDVDDGTIDPSQVAIERRMVTEDGHSVPWFTPPLPQDFSEDIPQILPFAPSLIVRGVYRQVSEVVSMGDGYGSAFDDAGKIGGSAADETRRRAMVEKYLHYPLLDISVLRHPDACFWWNKEDEEKAIGHILSYARRVPYALPFNLYIRVDPSRALRKHHGAEEVQRKEAAARGEANNGADDASDDATKAPPGLGALSAAFASDMYVEMLTRQEEKKKYFDLKNFRASAWQAADPRGGVMGGDLNIDGDAVGDEEAARPPRRDAVSDEPLFGGRARASPTQPIPDDTWVGHEAAGHTDGFTNEGIRHPHDFDEEVVLDGEDEASISDGLPNINTFSKAGGASSPRRGSFEDSTAADDDDDDLDDVLFPKVNPKGWD